MGLMDAITADARVEFKVEELYDVLRVAANNGKTAEFLVNAVKCEIPYKYIREIITGKKEESKENEIRIEIPRDIIEAAFEEAKAVAREAMAAAGIDPAIAGGDITVNTQINIQNADEVLKDCASENVSCGECQNRGICHLDLEGKDAEKYPGCFKKESEGGDK